MRNLNLDEITDKISDYSSDIQYCDRSHLEIKITQFLNFLFEQPISKRTLDRITEDFIEKKVILDENRNTIKWNSTKKGIIDSLKTRELQGAFAFFEILRKFQIERKHTDIYVDLANEWYKPRSAQLDKYRDCFNVYFFEPFIELIKWYFQESKLKNDIDYYSREEIDLFNSKLDKLEYKLTELGCGQEIIFNETDDIKELIKGLNKKNLTEIIKGKFNDLVLGEIISIETGELIIQTLTGEQISLR